MTVLAISRARSDLAGRLAEGAPTRSSWQGDLQGSLSPTRESIGLGCVICTITTIDSRAGHPLSTNKGDNCSKCQSRPTTRGTKAVGCVCGEHEAYSPKLLIAYHLNVFVLYIMTFVCTIWTLLTVDLILTRLRVAYNLRPDRKFFSEILEEV